MVNTGRKEENPEMERARQTQEERRETLSLFRLVSNYYYRRR